ncbi:hexose kinase [Vagococcus salmoninarum]|uniref:hexose kinase n=1 Tax=Vagococcus salmoninarum TaxID=2739 RepID=UPI003F99D8D9
MILTVTMNPAIDIAYPLETLAINTTNRVTSDLKSAGGKGLNVSRVLALKEQKVLATGLIGGDMGNYIKAKLEAEKISFDFYETEINSRMCLAILHDDGQQTELLENGGSYSHADDVGFINKFTRIIDTQPISLVTISGSLPQGISEECYQKMITIAKEKGLKVLLDSSGKAYELALKGQDKPYLIKPNQKELADLLGTAELTSHSQIIDSLAHPLLKDIPWIVVSLGSAGAIAKIEQEIYQVTIPKITAVSPVGSGDSTIAGLAMVIAHQQTIPEVLKTAMTLGILNTLEKRTGFVNTSNFNEYYEQITIKKI